MVRALRIVLRTLGAVDTRLARSYFASASVPKLHVGCGQRLLAGWLNSDYNPRTFASFRLNAARRFPFADASFDYVYSEHMIEHLTLKDGRTFLAECRRVLKPGGRVRIATPDMAFLVDLMRPDKSAVQEEYIRWATTKWPGAAGAGAVSVVNNFVRHWGHKFIYDAATLSRELEAAGLGEIARCELNQSSDPELQNLENESRMAPGFLRLETMVFEGVKARS